MKKLIILLCFVSISITTSAELKTVPNVDLKRYVGKWYEIASIPKWFSKGCNCTTAEYIMTDDDYIKVINSCRKDSPTGEIDKNEGKAWVVEGSNNSKLKVQFFWPFKGDYWILDLASDYSYAVVGNPKKSALWILSRTPKIDDKLYNDLIQKIKNMGYDISEIKKMNQECWK